MAFKNSAGGSVKSEVVDGFVGGVWGIPLLSSHLSEVVILTLTSFREACGITDSDNTVLQMRFCYHYA